MDRLPKDIAQEGLHHDIGRLLEEHVPPAPQPQVSQPLVPPTTMPAVSEAGHQMTPTKPRMATLPKNRIPSFKKNKNEEMMIIMAMMTTMTMTMTMRKIMIMIM